LRGVGTAYGGLELILDDFIQGVLTVKGLGAMIAAGNDDLIVRRMNIIDKSRHILNTAILDEGESFEKHSSNVRGLADLVDRLVLALASVSEIPVTLLMGQSPAGLQATGNADIRFFYDKIAARQEDEIEPILKRLIHLLLLQKDKQIQGVESDWNIIWRPLWQMTDAELGELHKQQAEADKIYLEFGVLTPDEVAKSRFGGDHYSIETELDDETRTEREAIEKQTEPPKPEPTEE
jgi:phage-related protein (TIGR01555 family)